MEIEFEIAFSINPSNNRMTLKGSMCGPDIKYENFYESTPDEPHAIVKGVLDIPAHQMLQTGYEPSELTILELTKEVLNEEFSRWSEGYYGSTIEFVDEYAEVVALAPNFKEINHFLNYLDKHDEEWDGDIHDVEKINVETDRFGSTENCYFFDIEEE